MPSVGIVFILAEPKTLLFSPFPRTRESRLFHLKAKTTWMPAFAGMTT
jgi:hypothetical protein